jgi:hypothetical protein
VGKERVVDGMREELIALVSKPIYELLKDYLDKRQKMPIGTRLPHPALRKKD